MKKYGKYEKRPEGVPEKQPKVKSMLLQTYFTSLLCLVLCVTMFFGTSYAWFTSEVQNTGNEIYIGTLDVGLYKQNGVDQEGKAQWDDLASSDTNTTKLFNGNIRWEPGYTALETIKVVNEGDLAFRYVLNFIEKSVSVIDQNRTLLEREEVAGLFDVWVYDHQENQEYDSEGNVIPFSKPTSYEVITAEDSGWENVGTLEEILSGESVLGGIIEKVRDDVPETEANTGTTDGVATEHTYTIALHLNGDEDLEDESEQEALNNLMGHKISLNVKLTAYQQTYEQDTFDANFDLGAFAGTLAQVTELSQKNVECSPWGSENAQTITLDAAYQFQPIESYEEAQAASYKDYVADFVVYADENVPAETMALAGYYKAYCDAFNDDKWVVLTSPETIAANTPIRLVQSMNTNVIVSYEALCQYGNDGTGFLCGVADLTGANAGTTITVELRLYEVKNDGSGIEETGRYITVGSYTYTFPGSTTETTAATENTTTSTESTY